MEKENIARRRGGIAMKKLMKSMFAIIFSIIMTVPLEVFADQNGEVNSIIPESAIVYYGEVDLNANDLPDDFYVVKTVDSTNPEPRMYREELLVSYDKLVGHDGTETISNKKYFTYTYLNGYTYVEHLQFVREYLNGRLYHIDREYTFY